MRTLCSKARYFSLISNHVADAQHCVMQVIRENNKEHVPITLESSSNLPFLAAPQPVKIHK